MVTLGFSDCADKINRAPLPDRTKIDIDHALRRKAGAESAKRDHRSYQRPGMFHLIYPLRRYSKGFYYMEVLLTAFLIAVALVPAMNALKTGISGGDMQKTLVTQQYHRISKMEELLSESFDNLVAAAQAAGDKNTLSSYSDAPGATDRRLVYLALYDADVDPFIVADPDTDGDNNVYTGSSANLIWLRVETEGTPHGLETLLSR